MLKNLLQPKNIGSGTAQYLLLAPAAWLREIKCPKPPFNHPGDSVRIFEDHRFFPGKGFLVIDLPPSQTSLTATSINEVGFHTLQQEIKTIVAGSYDVLHEQIKHLLNVPLVCLIKDSYCEDEIWYQFGRPGVHAYLTADFTTTADGKKGYNISVTYINEAVVFYCGDIEIYTPSIGNPVFLTDPSVTTIGGLVDDLEALYNTALSSKISIIQQELTNRATCKVIQLAFANDADEEHSEYLTNALFNTTTDVEDTLYNWLVLTAQQGQYLQADGDELLVVDNSAQRAFMGVAIPALLGDTDEFLMDDNQILIL